MILRGGEQSRVQWRDVGIGISQSGLQAVTVDLRGHGESDWSPSGSFVHDD